MLRNFGFEQIIIGLTGNSMEDELADFANAGADLVLTKPLRLEALEVLLLHFDRSGVKSKGGDNMFLDNEKLKECKNR